MEIENVIDTTGAITPCEHNHGTCYDYEGRVAICRACGKVVPGSERRDYNVRLAEIQAQLETYRRFVDEEPQVEPSPIRGS